MIHSIFERKMNLSQENEFILMKTLQTVIQEPINTAPEFIVPENKQSQMYLFFCYLISCPVYMFLIVLSKLCFVTVILKDNRK